MVKTRKIIIGITGASGSVYGLKLLEALRSFSRVESHLIISDAGRCVMDQEIGGDVIERALSLADYYYDIRDFSAAISSGSFITEGMIIAPCSAKTLSSVANGFSDNLITRCADVVLKERRKLVLLFRETPLNLAHIENMYKVSNMGAVLLPPVPAFYNTPKTLDEIILHAVGKSLDIFSFEHTMFKRWKSQ